MSAEVMVNEVILLASKSYIVEGFLSTVNMESCFGKALLIRHQEFITEQGLLSIMNVNI